MFEEIDVKKISKVALILSWIILLFYFLLKIFFGYEINLVCENVRILALCNFIDNNLIANYIVSSAFCFILMYLYYGAILRKIKLNRKEILITILCVLVANVFTYFGVLGTLFADILKFVVFPLIIMGKFKWKNVLTCLIFYALNFSFQIISALTTNVDIINAQNNMVISMIFSIDVIIMLIITLLYRRKDD